MTPAELAAQPLAGALLALDVGVRGLPEPRFAVKSTANALNLSNPSTPNTVQP